MTQVAGHVANVTGASCGIGFATAQRFVALYEGREEAVADTYPLRRLGVPKDVPGTVAFLCSRDGEWITGQTVVTDGGMTLTGSGL